MTWRVAMISAVAACSGDPNVHLPPFPLAVGGTATIQFQPDLCGGEQKDANTTIYTCADDAVKTIVSAEVAPPFEIVDSAGGEHGWVKFRANGAGDASLHLRYINQDDETHDVSYGVKAREPERVEVLASPLCESLRVLSGHELFVNFRVFGTDDGKVTQLISGGFPALASSSNLTVIETDRGRARMLAGSMVGPGRIESSLSPADGLDYEALDGTQVQIALVHPAAIPAGRNVGIVVQPLVGTTQACLPPKGPWTATVQPADVCSFSKFDAATTLEIGDLIRPNPLSGFGGAYEGLFVVYGTKPGTCQVELVHSALPLSASSSLTICAQEPCS